MKFIRDGKEIKIKNNSSVLLVDELLPILFRYPKHIQTAVFKLLLPYEIICVEEEDESKV